MIARWYQCDQIIVDCRYYRAQQQLLDESKSVQVDCSKDHVEMAAVFIWMCVKLCSVTLHLRLHDITLPGAQVAQPGQAKSGVQHTLLSSYTINIMHAPVYQARSANLLQH